MLIRLSSLHTQKSARLTKKKEEEWGEDNEKYDYLFCDEVTVKLSRVKLAGKEEGPGMDGN